jgi:hypothetical protein
MSKKLTSELAVSDGFRSTTNNVVFVYIHQAYLKVYKRGGVCAVITCVLYKSEEKQ